MTPKLHLGVLCALSLLGGSLAAAETAKPNVLWIVLEDVSGWFGCYGEKLIATPHIDRLAAEGTRFNRFYTSAGVCSATRSALMLGAMQTTFGVHHHRSSRNIAVGTPHDGLGMIHLPQGVLPLPQLCRTQGIFTFNEGHSKDDFNFVFRREDLYDFCPDLRELGPKLTIAGDCWRDRKPGQPLFGQVQLYGGKYGLKGRRATMTQHVDHSAVPVPPYYPDIPEVRDEIAHHYDCLVETDHEVGEIIAALHRDGLYDNTVIILFSDHGYVMHRHKQFLYEGGIRMPLIVAGPGIPKGLVRDDLVSSIDLAPATLGLFGLPVPAHMEGRDFLSPDHEKRDHVIAARDRCDYTIERIRAVVTQRFKYLRNGLTDRPYMQPQYRDPMPVTIAIRARKAHGELNGTQLLFYGDQKPAEELYDLEADPHEIHNLAADPAFAGELARHRKLLDDWIQATGDRGQQPEDRDGLIQVYYEWGDQCVNPEYEAVKQLGIQPKPNPARDKANAKAAELLRQAIESNRNPD
jgi:arylsulfatase A-like enzyme